MCLFVDLCARSLYTLVCVCVCSTSPWERCAVGRSMWWCVTFMDTQSAMAANLPLQHWVCVSACAQHCVSASIKIFEVCVCVCRGLYVPKGRLTAKQESDTHYKRQTHGWLNSVPSLCTSILLGFFFFFGRDTDTHTCCWRSLEYMECLQAVRGLLDETFLFLSVSFFSWFLFSPQSSPEALRVPLSQHCHVAQERHAWYDLTELDFENIIDVDKHY